MSEHADRRPTERRVRVRCATWQSFLELHARSLLRGGMFLRSDHPDAIGSLLVVELCLPDGRTLGLPAEVVQVVAPSSPGTAGRQPGMGVRFAAFDANAMLEVELLLRDARQSEGEAVATPSVASHETPSGDADFEDPDLLDALRNYVATLHDQEPIRAIGLEPGALPEEIDARLEALAERFAPEWYVDRSPEVRAAAAEVTLALRELRRRFAAGDRGGLSADGDAGLSAGQLFGDLEFLEQRAVPGYVPAPLHVPTHQAADWIRTGLALLRNRRYREAEEMLRRATEADPTDEGCRRDYALAQGHDLREMGRLDEAAQAFERALRADPDCAEAAAELRALDDPRRDGGGRSRAILGRFLRR